MSEILNIYKTDDWTAVIVTDETAASGKHSLKITDAPGLTYPYDPHLNYRVNYSEGLVRNSFDLRGEKGAQIDFEWRDWSESQYQTGPRFGIRASQLWIEGAPPLALPLSQWVHFEITAGLGKQGTGQ